MRSLRLLACTALAFALSGARVAAGDPADPDGLHVYFGNLHAHSGLSDGQGTPREAFTRARDAAKMDFYALTEHNHIGIDVDEVGYHGRRPGGGTEAGALIPTANAMTVDGSFVAIYGQEFSEIKQGNHVNVFDVSDVIRVEAGKFQDLLTWLDSHRDTSGAVALVQLNHPATKNSPTQLEYGRDDFGTNENWRSKMDGVAELISILNGPSHSTGDGLPPPKPMERDFRQYLRLGFHVAPTADHDTHRKNWGTVTDTRTGVIAKELTRAAVLQALRARHAYATEDRNLRVIARVNGSLCGDIVAPPAEGSEFSIAVSLHDDDEPQAKYEIEVWSGLIGGEDAKVVERINVSGNGVKTVEDVRYGGGFQYFYLKVLQHGPDDDEHHDTDDAWTAPVWFEPGAAAPAPVAVDVSRVVASRHSDIYHIDPACSAAQSIKEHNRVFGAAAMVGRTRHPGCPTHH